MIYLNMTIPNENILVKRISCNNSAMTVIFIQVQDWSKHVSLGKFSKHSFSEVEESMKELMAIIGSMKMKITKFYHTRLTICFGEF